MNNNYNLSILQPMDRIVLPMVGFPLLTHHALFFGKDRYGKRIYIENVNDFGVRFISEAELFKNRPYILKFVPFSGNDMQRKNATNLAVSYLETKYDLLKFNCEHFANIVQNLRSYSLQVDTLIITGFIFAMYKLNKAS